MLLHCRNDFVFSNSKTPRWLNSKSEEERQQLLQKAHNRIQKLEQYRSRRLTMKMKMLKERACILQAKKMEFEHIQEKKLKEKEALTQSIYSSLWVLAVKTGYGERTIKH